MCYDKALEIRPEYGYASYKKGILLEKLSRYEEALECFEGFGDKRWHDDRDTAESDNWGNTLHRQILRDKLKPNEDGSIKSFETYCRILGNFLKKDRSKYNPEIELARKKLNENILQHIHKLGDSYGEDDFYERGEWLQDIGREKEALEHYDKRIEKELERGDLHMAAWANETKAYYLEKLGRSKDEFDCYEKTIQFCEKSRKDLTEDAAEYLSNAYSRNAHYFRSYGDQDKAMEYISHAIKLDREYGDSGQVERWRTKVSWLPDEEAIKFLDEEIKAWHKSSYDEDWRENDKKYHIDAMNVTKNKLLKDLKSNT
jgi:tetratricopeptide (TPR) repeat protein